MSAVIRLKRIGTKKKPFSRIVVCNSKVARDGKPIEEIGLYDPLTEPAFIRVDKERALHWLKVGARPSNTVASIFKKAGISL